MSFKISDNTETIKNNFSIKANIFLRTFADQVVRTSSPNTPKKSGRLRMDTLKQVLGLKGKIVWGKGYAARQETRRARNYTTPGTGPHFAENAIKSVVKLTTTIAKQSGLI